MQESRKIGLALSGGGFRAAAFHLGTLRKLNEMGILQNVDVISTISGGSIAGAYYILHKDNFLEFETSFKACLKKSVLKRIALFLVPLLMLYIFLIGLVFHFFNGLHWWFRVIPYLLVFLLLRFQFLILPITELKNLSYGWIFFRKKKICDLPESPELAINATNLETGTLWTFSKRKVGDSSYLYPKDSGNSIRFKAQEFPVSFAVACSTCVPFPFNPIKIKKKYFTDEKDFKRVRPLLVDGGLYDNQGIHKLTQKNSSYACDIIIVSDGSQPFSFSYTGHNSISVLQRANDIMMRKIKNLQFIRDIYLEKFEIAYFSLDWEYERCVGEFLKLVEKKEVSNEVVLYHNIPSKWLENFEEHGSEILNLVKQNIDFRKVVSSGLSAQEVRYISKISTSLSAFSDKTIDLLSRHAAALTELQIKLYCPSLNPIL